MIKEADADVDCRNSKVDFDHNCLVLKMKFEIKSSLDVFRLLLSLLLNRVSKKNKKNRDVLFMIANNTTVHLKKIKHITAFNNKQNQLFNKLLYRQSLAFHRF